MQNSAPNHTYPQVSAPRPRSSGQREPSQVQVEATWGIYQRMIAAYREPDRVKGRDLMVKLIESLSQGVPAVLSEIVTLGRTGLSDQRCKWLDTPARWLARWSH